MAKVDTIIVQWKNQCYQVKKEDWLKNQLDATITGDAQVLVRRGAVVADIPGDVPFGTFCILINLDSIV